MVVEDDADVRGFLVRALRRLGPQPEVIACADGYEALVALGDCAVDLIISDQWMPRMQGLELLRLCRARCDVPFVIISADRSIAQEALDAGANRFLTKPVSLAALRNILDTLVPSYRERI
jgi:two-component system cell cycle response regulator CpdR